MSFELTLMSPLLAYYTLLIYIFLDSSVSVKYFQLTLYNHAIICTGEIASPSKQKHHLLSLLHKFKKEKVPTA